MALQERTTPPGIPNQDAPQRRQTPIILLNGAKNSTHTQIVRLLAPIDEFAGVRFAYVEGGTNNFSFDPLIDAMKASGIEDPHKDPSWPKRRSRFVQIPQVIKILEANGMD